MGYRPQLSPKEIWQKKQQEKRWAFQPAKDDEETERVIAKRKALAAQIRERIEKEKISKTLQALRNRKETQ